MKYVGETGSQCPLKAAVSVANGYDISHGLTHIRKTAWMLDRCALGACEHVCMYLDTAWRQCCTLTRPS